MAYDPESPWASFGAFLLEQSAHFFERTGEIETAQSLAAFHKFLRGARLPDLTELFDVSSENSGSEENWFWLGANVDEQSCYDSHECGEHKCSPEPPPRRVGALAIAGLRVGEVSVRPVYRGEASGLKLRHLAVIAFLITRIVFRRGAVALIALATPAVNPRPARLP